MDGVVVGVGNDRLAAQLGCSDVVEREGVGSMGAATAASNIAQAGGLLKKWEREGGTVGWVVAGGEAVAVWCVADRVREEAPHVVSLLRQMGVGMVMLTGDNAGAGSHVGQTIGLAPHDIFCQLLPHEKVSRVREISGSAAAGDRAVEQGDLEEGSGGDASETDGCCANVGVCVLLKDKIGMVGDGVNDAPALAGAHVGVAMGAAGSAVAMETADVVLMDSNLRKIPVAIQMGRATLLKIRQNVAIAIITKVVMIGLTVANLSTLWLAIVSDVGAMLLVTMNGMTLLSWSPRSGPSPEEPKGGCAAAAAAAATAAAAAAAGEHTNVSDWREEDEGLGQMASGGCDARASTERVKAKADVAGTGGEVLTVEQQDMLEALMERTGMVDMREARQILEASKWQLHKAAMAYRKGRADSGAAARKFVSTAAPAGMPRAAATAVPAAAAASGGGCGSKKGC